MKLQTDFNFLPQPDFPGDLSAFSDSAPDIPNYLMKELVQLADRCSSMEPWNVVCESDLFGIRDEQTGALHVVSVGGNAGQTGFSLQCHMPPEGIIFWQNAFRGIDPGEMPPGLTEIRLLECQFKEATDSLKGDLSVYRRHRRKKTPPNLVPCFRSYRPGFYPWFQDAREVEKMIRVFRLFFRFYTEIYPRKSEFYQWNNPFGEMPGIPVFYLDDNGRSEEAGDWKVKMEVLPSECLSPLKPRPEDDPHRSDFEEMPVIGETWEIGTFYMPTPVFQGERPYYPKSAVSLKLTDHESRCPCDPIIYGGNDSDTVVIRQSFRELVKHCQYLPERIRVDCETTYSALETYSDAFGIELILGRLELMPLLISEIVHSLDDCDNWEDRMLGDVIRAIPDEFQIPLGEPEMEESIHNLATRILIDSEEEDLEPPGNIVFADFSSPASRVTGSGKD